MAVKQYLDSAGLTNLWDKIKSGYAQRWKVVDYDNFNYQATSTEGQIIIQNLNNLNETQTGDYTIGSAVPKTISVPTATQELSGLLSPNDKKKIDELSDNIENTITIKKIKVGNQLTGGSSFNAVELTVDNDTNKAVAFGLNYNAGTDLLSIIDLNNNNAVLSQVHVLGDALKELTGFTDADVIVENGITYLKFTLSVKDQSGETQSKELKINVNDLVSLYTAGKGISITTASNSLTDDNATSVTIDVIAPKTVSSKHEIGGIIPKKIYSNAIADATWGNSSGSAVPTIQTIGTQSARYFGIETDKNGHAFVNVPSAEIAKGSATVGTGTINNTNTSDPEFTVVTDVDVTLSDDGQTYTVTPKKTKYTVTRETTLSKNANSATVTQKNIELNGETSQSFDVISDITVNDHAITLSKVTHTIKETELNISDEKTDPDDVDITLDPGNENTVDVTVMTGLVKTAHHGLQRQSKTLKIKVNDPDSIPIATIQNLTYNKD